MADLLGLREEDPSGGRPRSEGIEESDGPGGAALVLLLLKLVVFVVGWLLVGWLLRGYYYNRF